MVVERFLAWTNRNRRLAKDFARTLASAEAFLYIKRHGMAPHRRPQIPFW